MTNEELVRQIRTETDTAKDMLTLYLQNKGMISQIARKYAHLADVEDLTQEGYIGLCDAVGHYDLDCEIPFISYAWVCVKRKIQRYVSQERNFPDYMASLIGRYKGLENRFRQQHGRVPTTQEAARELDVSGEQIRSLKNVLAAEQMASLEASIGEEGMCLGDMVASGEDLEWDVVEKVQKEQLKAALWNAVDKLPGKQPEVIRKRYQDQMSLQQIGDSLGMSRDKVRHEEVIGILSLRNRGRNHHLYSFMEGDILTTAMRGTGVESFQRTWTSATERAAMELV